MMVLPQQAHRKPAGAIQYDAVQPHERTHQNKGHTSAGNPSGCNDRNANNSSISINHHTSCRDHCSTVWWPRCCKQLEKSCCRHCPSNVRPTFNPSATRCQCACWPRRPPSKPYTSAAAQCARLSCQLPHGRRCQSPHANAPAGPLVRRSPAIRCRRVCGPTLLHTLSATGSQCACGPCTVSYQVPIRPVPLSTSLCRISCCCSSPSTAVTSCTKLGCRHPHWTALSATKCRYACKSCLPPSAGSRAAAAAHQGPPQAAQRSATMLQAPRSSDASTVSYQVPMRLVALSTSLCRVSCCCSSPSKAVISCTKLGRASASACQHCSAMDAYACGGGSSSRHGYRDQQDMSIEGRYDTGVTACQHCSAMEAYAC